MLAAMHICRSLKPGQHYTDVDASDIFTVLAQLQTPSSDAQLQAMAQRCQAFAARYLSQVGETKREILQNLLFKKDSGMSVLRA